MSGNSRLQTGQKVAKYANIITLPVTGAVAVE
jgi:hypothetical protein